VSGRAHTGSRRNEDARRAILDATATLLREEGYGALSVGAIAKAAGVGRQTIYRWWPSKADVVLEVLTEQAGRSVAEEPPPGPLQERLRAFLRTTFATARDPEVAAALRALAAEAQKDAAFAERLAAFLERRRAVLGAIVAGDVPAAGERALVVDLVFGLLWYRTLVGHEPLDDGTADLLAALLTRPHG
jgi:AcrR family transcriptional regulator